jgi:hypothetical protein
MNRLFKSIIVVITLVSLYSCSKCTTCEIIIDQEGVGQTKRSTLEKCGTRKEIKEFKENLEATYKPYGEEAVVSCTDN